VKARISPLRKPLSAQGIRVPGDKSISHRALMFAALAEGESRIAGLAPGGDVRSTARCLAQLGVRILRGEEGMGPDDAVVFGQGLRGLREPPGHLDCGNSGTTLRLLTGILAGAGLEATLTGDASLSGRPMERVARPLRALGATVETAPGGKPPVVVRRGHPLRAGVRGGERAGEERSAARRALRRG
jgi:3-phosphoshikimate 1-carboxyvinyltransferase